MEPTEIVYKQLIIGAQSAHARANFMESIAKAMVALQAQEVDAIPELAKLLNKHGICLIEKNALRLAHCVIEHAIAHGEHDLGTEEIELVYRAVEKSIEARS